MGNYKLFVFDMDGVLVNTAPSHVRAYEDLWSMIGVQGPRYEAIAGCKTSDVIASVAKALKPSARQIDQWTRFKQERSRTYLTTEVITYDDTIPSLAALAQSNVLLALGTGASRETADLLLKKVGIFKFFNIVLTAEDVRKGKPAPEIYLNIMSKASVHPETTLIIEDSISGLEAAVASEAWVAAVRSGHSVNYSRFIGWFANVRDLLGRIAVTVS
jgi:HAD superfamily hydrolase (TIGR01509 family)